MMKKFLSLGMGVSMIAIGIIPAVFATETATTNIENLDNIAIAIDNTEPFGSLNGGSTADTTVTITSSTDNTGQTFRASTAACGSCSEVDITVTSNSTGGARFLVEGATATSHQLVHSSTSPTITNSGFVALDDVSSFASVTACSVVATSDEGIGFRIMANGETNSSTDTTWTYSSDTATPGPGNNIDVTLVAKYITDGYCAIPATAVASDLKQAAVFDEYQETGQVATMDIKGALLAAASLKTGDYTAAFLLTPESNAI
jgi:hypothetical protein